MGKQMILMRKLNLSPDNPEYNDNLVLEVIPIPSHLTVIEIKEYLAHNEMVGDYLIFGESVEDFKIHFERSLKITQNLQGQQLTKPWRPPANTAILKSNPNV